MKTHKIMASDPVSLSSTASTIEAARAMRDADTATIVVMDGHQILGTVTERDIVLRVLAEARDPVGTLLREICTRQVPTLSQHE
jgi:predicted transcriptional regulator